MSERRDMVERAATPGFGREWTAAIEHGIDVTLLLENSELSPAERIRRLDALNEFATDLQSRTVPAPLREALARARVGAKLRALDPNR